jgi:hypothetical protein
LLAERDGNFSVAGVQCSIRRCSQKQLSHTDRHESVSHED